MLKFYDYHGLALMENLFSYSVLFWLSFLLWESRKLCIHSKKMILLQQIPILLLSSFFLPFYLLLLLSFTLLGINVLLRISAHKTDTNIGQMIGLAMILLLLGFVSYLLGEINLLSIYGINLLLVVFFFPISMSFLHRYGLDKNLQRLVQILTLDGSWHPRFYLLWGIFQLLFLSSTCMAIYIEFPSSLMIVLQVAFLGIGILSMRNQLRTEYQDYIRRHIQQRNSQL